MNKVYVLSGAYNDCDNDGVYVVAVSDNLDVIKEKMKEIVESKGKEYLQNTFGELKEEIQERYYEVRDRDGSWANFFITENELEGEPKTNGDRIRRMSDEELVSAMLCPCDCFGKEEEMLEWLAKEVE